MHGEIPWDQSASDHWGQWSLWHQSSLFPLAFHTGKVQMPVSVVLLSTAADGEGEAEPWQSACWVFSPSIFPSSLEMHQPRSLLEARSWILSSRRREFSHFSQGSHHPDCSPKRWENCKLTMQEKEVGIRPVTNTTLNKGKFKNYCISALLIPSWRFWHLSEDLSQGAQRIFFACNRAKLRSYRARKGLVGLVGRWSGKGRLLKMKVSHNKGVMEGSKETQGSQLLFQDWLLRDLSIHTSDMLCVIRNPTPRWVWVLVTSWCRAQTSPGIRQQ